MTGVVRGQAREPDALRLTSFVVGSALAPSRALALALAQDVDHDVERARQASNLVVGMHNDVGAVVISALQRLHAARQPLDRLHDGAGEEYRKREKDRSHDG